MRLLFIGDIVGDGGLDFVCNNLSKIMNENKIDFVIANGENVSEGNGINKDSAEKLRYAGVDVITTGNHAFRRKSSYVLMEESDFLLRPYNCPSRAIGKGVTELNTSHGKVGVVNLSGQLYMDGYNNPFDVVEKIISSLSHCDFIFVDFHAEATSEKRAMGFFLDGKVTGVFGTHTHVQTSDEQILPNGTAYITDVGMTGGKNSILGVKKETVINKFLTGMPGYFEQDNTDILFNSVVFDSITKEIYRLNIN